ncbi:MAG: aminotransferase class I/II-fold pyridoxal phosphate-dependent enzyme [Clostridiales bacterium]|jgi:8-amino-7-oxononanoate synthase|nr:aminotransferase class I/II-fold pyridoxal phosphate-dependent enzyme [Clostridiales bacterium]
MDLFDKCNAFNAYCEATKKKGVYPYFHEITSMQHSEVTIGGRRTIMLGSNNYMGLTSDPRVIEAARDALAKYGTGCSGSRFLNGTLSLHIRLEKEIAEFTGFEDVMTFSTGFQTNLGILSAICGRGDYVLFDRANHASLVDAARLSFAKTVKYGHNDTADLEAKLKEIPEDAAKLIVVDGVFSMEGDLADLPRIVPLAKKYKCRLMVDDSHGLGVMGANGRGAAEYFGLEKDVDILMGTFSKSFASLGGFMAAPAGVINYCRHASRPFIFSASMPPANAAAALAALEIIRTEKWRLKKVLDNADYLRSGLQKLGLPAGDSLAPIVPVRTYGDERTFAVTRALLDEGVYVNPVISPAVPEGDALLRTSCTATHTREQLDFALEGFKKVFARFPYVKDENAFVIGKLFTK